MRVNLGVDGVDDKDEGDGGENGQLETVERHSVRGTCEAEEEGGWLVAGVNGKRLREQGHEDIVCPGDTYKKPAMTNLEDVSCLLRVFFFLLTVDACRDKSAPTWHDLVYGGGVGVLTAGPRLRTRGFLRLWMWCQGWCTLRGAAWVWDVPPYWAWLAHKAANAISQAGAAMPKVAMNTGFRKMTPMSSPLSNMVGVGGVGV